MPQSTLTSAPLIALVAAPDRDGARGFYQGTLGLRLVREDDFALVFDAHGTVLRVSIVEHLEPAPFAVLGWQVTDIAAAVAELGSRGVSFHRYPGMDQDPDGIWRSPSGASVAWFGDPAGNVLSLTQS